MTCECDELRDKLRQKLEFCRECGAEALKELEQLPQAGSEAVSAESALLCGNGNNKLFIAVTCKHHVYNEEWEELAAVINMAIGDYKGGDFKNVIAMITPAL